MIFFSSLLDTVWTELSAWQQKTQNTKMLMLPVARGTLHRKTSILQKMPFKQLFEVLLWLYTYVVTTKQLLCCEALLCVCTELNTDCGSVAKAGRHPHRLTLCESLPQKERIVLDIVFTENWEKRKPHRAKTNKFLNVELHI